jgi:hypothetical protein
MYRGATLDPEIAHFRGSSDLRFLVLNVRIYYLEFVRTKGDCI